MKMSHMVHRNKLRSQDSVCGILCFSLIDIIYIFILKCGIPLITLIFIPYDSQGISIIDPVTGDLGSVHYLRDGVENLELGSG